MTTTVVKPNLQIIGHNLEAYQGAIDTVIGQVQTDINALQAGTSESAQIGTSRTVRGVVTANVAALATFTVASNDGLTYVAGDRVLLTGQTTASQNGIYVVGTVGGGTAPLTRPADWATGLVIPGLVIESSEGTTNANTSWSVTTTGTITVDTTPVAVAQSTAVVGTPPPYFRARNVVIANVASLAAFAGVTGGTPNNGVTCVQGDYVLLTNQTTVAENGLYQVGVIAANVAPLTRVPSCATGQAIAPDTIVQIGSEPTVGKNTQWRASCVASKVYGTDDPKFVCDFGNFIDMMSTTTGTSGATPSNYFFAGCVLVAKSTGIFEVDIDVDFTSDTSAQAVTIAFLTDTSASGALGGANNVAHGISGVTAAIGTQVGAGATVDTNGGATMTYNAAGWSTAPITHKSKITGSLTGLLTTNGSGTNTFSFKGKVFNAAETGTTKTPFTIGNSVGFGLKVTAAGGTISFPNVKMSVKEVPAG